MIGVDISGIWCSIALPELLQTGDAIAEAHKALLGTDGIDMAFSFLGQSDAARRAYCTPAVAAAEKIRTDSQALLVIGDGAAVQGVRAVLRLRFGRKTPSPRILYAGDGLSGEDWLCVISALENTDFSVLVTTPCGEELPPLVALRSLRWIMEKRYGDKAKERVYIACGAQKSPLRNLAEAEGYTILEVPSERGAADSMLNPAGLLIAAVAGLNASLIVEGAAQMRESCDDRSLDNPAWLYAAAQYAAKQRQMDKEYFCVSGAYGAELGQWWMRRASRGCTFVSALRIPGDIGAVGDALYDRTRRQLVTLLTLPLETKKVTVESAWRDPDRLGAIAGQDLAYLTEKTNEAFRATLADAGVPLLRIECEQTLTEDGLGELFCFLEFSALLSEQLGGTKNGGAQAFLRDLDKSLGRN